MNRREASEMEGREAKEVDRSQVLQFPQARGTVSVKVMLSLKCI